MGLEWLHNISPVFDGVRAGLRSKALDEVRRLYPRYSAALTVGRDQRSRRHLPRRRGAGRLVLDLGERPLDGRHNGTGDGHGVP